ncbi:MAG: hypothetical protein AAF682_30380 [Planctomycetota bacterium]
MPSTATARASLAALCLMPTLASAQLVLLDEIQITASDDLESVEIAGDTAIVSHRTDGLQSFVDITSPFSMTLCPSTTFNPSFGDIFGESLYYDGLGGHLFTGHRFGGLTMNDASDPCATMFQVAAVNTQYMHEGLDAWSDGTNHFLVYGEHPAFTTVGGIRIYDIGASSLTEIGNVLNPAGQLDGGDVVFSPDGAYVYQISPSGYGPGSTTVNNTALVVYDTSNKSAPAFLFPVDLPGSAQSTDAELVHAPDSPYLYLAMFEDGLQVVNVTNPMAPTVKQFFALPGISIEEVEFYHPKILLTSGRIIETGQSVIVPLNVSDPDNPIILGVISAGGRVRDIKVDNGLVYVATTNTALNNNALQVYL